MKIAGITAEYNPFHNGHKNHIEVTKKGIMTENIFIIMSGNFTQRGEPAIIDKYQRTYCALKNGADIVAELPCVFASSGAEFFASAAIKMFNDSGICSHISFGAETDDIEKLKKNAAFLENEDPYFKKLISENMAKGMSFPSAREIAMKEILGEEPLISTPNNILACEYIKMLISLKSSIIPFAVKRKGNDYNQTELSGKLSSASAIRNSIENGKIEDILSSVPEETYSALISEISKGKAPINFNSLSHILNYKIRSLSTEELAFYHGVTEGLENKIKRSVDTAYNAHDIAMTIKSKRYTLSRIQRFLLHMCLDIKNDDLLRYKQNGYSPYIRILGFKKEKEYLLKEIAKKSSVPVIVNIKNAHKTLDDVGMEILNKEIYADNIYYSLCPNKKFAYTNQDFTTPVVII